MHNLTKDELDKIKKELEKLDRDCKCVLPLAEVKYSTTGICALDIVNLCVAFEDILEIDMDTITVGQALEHWSEINVSNK